MSRVTDSGAPTRRAWVAVLMLALFIRVLAPPGFMFAARAGHSLPVVICTGHGPALQQDGAAGAPAQKSKANSACAFAGDGIVGGAPAHAVIAAFERVVFAETPVTRIADLAPGRGMAAPPPLSHAPPTSPLTA